MANPEKTKPRDDGRRVSEIHRIGKEQSAHHTETPPDVNMLLSRLDRARQYGKGWTARCPAHEDRSASLSVAVAESGAILCHCFAGCAVGDVLGAVGLSVSDLFPQRLRDQSPAGRRELREHALQARWSAALTVLAFEAAVVHAAAHAVLRGPLSEADRHRLTLAADRIDGAQHVLVPSPAFRPRAAA